MIEKSKPMHRRTTIHGAAIILGLAVCLYLGTPPSDASLIRRLQQYPEIQQLVAMFHQDQQPMLIDAQGMIHFADTAPNRLAQARLDAYRSLVARSGAQRAIIGSATVGIELDYPTFWHLPGLTVKSLRYAPVPPAPLTDGATDFYHFLPGQRQYVCRPVGDRWYVCKDNED